MLRLYLALCGMLVSAAAPDAFGQAPLIQSGGVQNAASNITLHSISPQMLIAIKGQNLATSTEVAQGYPLPTKLGGASVTFDGVPAPLLYASPTQINAQVPTAVHEIGTINIVVTTAAGSSAPYHPLSEREPGLLGVFTQDATGCGQAVAFNIHSDGRPLSLNTPQNSLNPEKDRGLAIFLTGVDFFVDRIDGVPWTYNPKDNEAYLLKASLGAPGITALWGQFPNLELQYVGPAPDKVGIDQANVLLGRSGVPEGCRVPLYLYTQAGFSSQLVDVSIHSGGGMCADPLDSMLGSVTWQQTTVSDTSGDSTAATITAQFIQSDGLGFAPPLALLIGPDGYSAPSGLAVPIVLQFQSPPAASACSASLPTTLDAGELNLSGPGFGPLTMRRSTQDGRLTYEVPAPGGAIRPGAYKIDGSGGQVGAFTARGQIPAPISITTKLQPGTGLTADANGNYTFAWTGGSDDSVVTVQFILVDAAFEAVAATSASAGSISISESVLCAPPFQAAFCFQPLSPGQSVELIITQTPPKAPSLPFSAPGLGMGGELTWTYTFDFKGLTT